VQDGPGWLQFEGPESVVAAFTPAEVLPALGELETAAGQGLWAAGFLAYEAAAAFGLAVRSPQPGLPLLWFGLYRSPSPALPPPAPAPTAGLVERWDPGLDASLHGHALASLKERIAAGDTYQVNFTFPLTAPLTADPWALFSSLFQAQRPGHAAYLDAGRFAVCSVSPELFFDWDEDRLTTRPMKGTAPRGRTARQDEACARGLLASEKDRAENLMIVDMLRNDLGRVAEPGSVKVTELFAVERYPTLLQMTSSVEARTKAGLAEILGALFPCASVTGAPKVRTMEIIAETEAGPRGIYTGAIGFVAPGRRARFNVAIRTVVVDRELREARYGVGSGVVADSSAAGEYAECLLKARILSEPPFRLLETMRYDPGLGLFLGPAHLDRLMASAAFFAGDVSRSHLEDALQALGARLDRPSRVRLLVDLDGHIETQVSPLEERGQVWNCESQFTIPDLTPARVALAKTPVDETSPWLYHKTTRREVYDLALRQWPEAEDVVLWNQRGELTESCRANLVLDLGGGFVTPKVESGLLDGTLRAHLVASGQVREQVVKVDDLAHADRLYLVNSVRGVWPFRLLAGAP
jgi:para-aminobenzoate synthetase/4-amino-4-deoxychorismate lyase